MTDGFDDRSAYGMIDGLDDASMGWARYAQSTKHMNLNSGLFYVSANANTLALMERLADRLSRQKYWDQTAFNEEIFFLSHGDTTVIPISVRVMEYWRFMNSKVRQAPRQYSSEVGRTARGGLCTGLCRSSNSGMIGHLHACCLRPAAV